MPNVSRRMWIMLCLIGTLSWGNASFFEKNKEVIERVSISKGVSPSLMLSVSWVESGMDEHALYQRKRMQTVGLFQIPTKTEAEKEKFFDPEANTKMAADRILACQAEVKKDKKEEEGDLAVISCFRYGGWKTFSREEKKRIKNDSRGYYQKVREREDIYRASHE